MGHKRQSAPARALADLLQERQWSHNRAAIELGVSDGSIGHWLKTDRMPKAIEVACDNMLARANGAGAGLLVIYGELGKLRDLEKIARHMRLGIGTVDG